MMNPIKTSFVGAHDVTQELLGSILKKHNIRASLKINLKGKALASHTGNVRLVSTYRKSTRHVDEHHTPKSFPVHSLKQEMRKTLGKQPLNAVDGQGVIVAFESRSESDPSWSTSMIESDIEIGSKSLEKMKLDSIPGSERPRTRARVAGASSTRSSSLFR